MATKDSDAVPGGNEYTPSGVLQGDTSPMPYREAGAGATDTYGADLGMDATNSEGSIASATKSDGMDFA